MARAPLSTLLSQALVAYTIEFDDLAEQRMLHGTTVGGLAGMRAGGVWFTSQVMWTNFVRHIDRTGRPIREVQQLACLSDKAIKSRLHHLEWWSYLKTADKVVQLTPNGERAAASWAPIGPEIDARWKKRFGKATLDALTTALKAIVAAEARDLPDYMPVVDYGDGMRATLVMPAETPARTPPEKLDVSALLSRALLAMTLEFERGSDVSLTAAANVLRVVDDGGTSLKELPMRAGVAKEGQIALVNFLKKQGHLSIGADKAKTVTLTARGKGARDYPNQIAKIEKRWAVAALRKNLDAILDHPRFIVGLAPHSGSWRENKRYATQTAAVLAHPRAGLPHHPMITHRGGFPDGS